MKKGMGMILLLFVFGFYGCEYETSSPTSSESGVTETAAPNASDAPAAKPGDAAPADPAAPEKTEESESNTDAGPADIELQFDAETTGGDDAEYVEKKAAAGVTHKGEFADSSEKPMSIVTVPLATYFSAKEKTVFDIQIPQAMNLYKATNGEFPKTEEVFMSDIISANQIHLPELKEGDEYFYDPDAAQLMVRAKK